MNRQVKGVIRLTRFKDYFFFVIITTLLGAAAGNGKFDRSLILVLIANWLAVGFAFMINDIEDAPDDALCIKKASRNPICAHLLSSRLAHVITYGAAFLAMIFYASLGLKPFLLGVSCLLLGFLYSWRLVRFKTLPFVDMVSHAMMLAGLQFLCAYFSFSATFNGKWLYPFLCVLCISLYGELFNELRDLEVDKKAGLTHTAITLGSRVTNIVMTSFGIIGLLAGILTLAVDKLMPFWVLIFLVVLTSCLLLPSILRIERKKSSVQFQEPFQRPIEIAAAFALLLQFIGPWVTGFFSLNAIWTFILYLGK